MSAVITRPQDHTPLPFSILMWRSRDETTLNEIAVYVEVGLSRLDPQQFIKQAQTNCPYHSTTLIRGLVHPNGTVRLFASTSGLDEPKTRFLMYTTSEECVRMEESYSLLMDIITE